jgi:hypothetical protein
MVTGDRVLGTRHREGDFCFICAPLLRFYGDVNVVWGTVFPKSSAGVTTPAGVVIGRPAAAKTFLYLRL